jgi:hypothetical protein
MSNSQTTDGRNSVLRMPRTWIFQANPKMYHIDESLRVEAEEYWNLRQNSKKVSVGDRVLIWISGDDAGIYAFGHVKTVPILMPDSATGISYWYDEREGRQPRPRVLVRYDRVWLDRPLRKVFLQNDPDFWDHQIIRFPVGTNFAVSETEWQALRVWLNL